MYIHFFLFTLFLNPFNYVALFINSTLVCDPLLKGELIQLLILSLSSMISSHFNRIENYFKFLRHVIFFMINFILNIYHKNINFVAHLIYFSSFRYANNHQKKREKSNSHMFFHPLWICLDKELYKNLIENEENPTSQSLLIYKF